jgi:hypothetical protein
MILLKSSSDHLWPWADTNDEITAEKQFKMAYPSLYSHMKKWESFVDADTGARRGLRHRLDHGRFWWELRSCAYYEAFEQPKVTYQEIQFWPQYAVDHSGRFGNNKTFLIASALPELPVILNSPLLWWFNWRNLPHMKDEALTPVAFKMQMFRSPI